MTREMDLLEVPGFKFQFTRSWFRTRNLSTFREFLHPHWVGKPVKYLELGVFEGMSMVWMLQHILTHEDSQGVGVDPWLMTSKLSGSDMDSVRQRATFNTAIYIKCQLIRACSCEALRRMNKRRGFAGIRKDSVDICMIDGDHNSGAVLDDARLVFPLMKVGGWILFDDVENDREKTDHVKAGLELYLNEETRLKQVWKNKYVECFERVE